MGNCVRKQSSMQWGGEDWGSFDENRNKSGESTDYYTEEKRLLGERKEVSSSFEAGAEVKVKITKKQLEELLKRRTDIQGLSANQILAELMNVSDQIEADQISWRPALQSIPEYELSE